MKLLRWTLFGLLTLLLVSYIFRSPAVSWIVNRATRDFNRKYNADLSIRDVRIIGMAGIRLTGISLQPRGGEMLCSIDTAFVSVGIVKLLAGRISIHRVELKNARFTIREDQKGNNYMFLLRQKRAIRSDSADYSSGYAASLDRLLMVVFDKIPLSLGMQNFSVDYKSPGYRMRAGIGDLELRNHFFRTVIDVEEDSLSQQWIVAGRIDNGERLAEFRMWPAGKGAVRLPYLEWKWNAGIDFDTLSFGFREMESDTDMDEVLLDGFFTFRGLSVDHPMVARVPVVFDRLGVNCRLHVGPDYAEVDSSSSVVFNRLDIHPYVRLQKKPFREVRVSVRKPPFPSQDLFSSFPGGLFTTLEGLETGGKLSWFLNFRLDPDNPDSLVFETELKRHNFSIRSLGNSNLTRISEPFSHTVWEDDMPVRTFIVGPENPDFRRLDQISPWLPVAVMTSEDGAFYQHRGFLPDAFRESMITNIKERRFARGGSTISMQLVKNVFLNRNKTVARKLEEALVVWLIENQGLATKERMMEVYLNIIEWGPGIYGSTEASRFYFAKDAGKLTPAEAIFMASIIPRPKSFRYSFGEDGRLRPSMAEYYALVLSKMEGKGWITAEEAARVKPDVELRGPAGKMLKRGDTLQ